MHQGMFWERKLRAERKTQWSQTHVTELGKSNKNFRKDKAIMPLHHGAPQPWSCCCSSGDLTTQKEVKLEVWPYKKDNYPCKAPPPIFKDQVHLSERREWHMDSSTTEVLPAVLTQASSSNNLWQRHTPNSWAVLAGAQHCMRAELHSRSNTRRGRGEWSCTQP